MQAFEYNSRIISHFHNQRLKKYKIFLNLLQNVFTRISIDTSEKSIILREEEFE